MAGIKNSLEQLEYCQQYFHHSSATQAKDFYQHLRILIDCLPTSAALARSTKEILEDICVSLLQYLASCNLQFDGQLLCSTAFCSALQTVLENREIKDLFYSFLHTENLVHLPFKEAKFKILEINLDVFKVCLIHGILQSIALSTIVQIHLPFIMFDCLEKTCMKYSRLTNTSFKVLVLWTAKVYLSVEFELSVDISQRIFTIINNNWENPINGVKEQNVKMFELFLDVCTRHTPLSHECSDSVEVFKSVENILSHIMREQPWKMRSKYFMLTSLLPRYGVKKAFLEFPDLVHGLISSISQSHLVSTGTDLYKSCLKNLLIDDWVKIFMTPVVAVLMDKSQVVSVGKQNMFNYWIPPTVKMFPSLLNMLLEELLHITDNWENHVFSIISLVKLGRKTGKLLNIWDEEFQLKMLSLTELLNYSLEHCNEVIRAEAFALVCSCTKRTVVPSSTEFELIMMFLSNNINIDSALLRQAMLNSFTLFLMRVLESSLYELKKVKELDDEIQVERFLDSIIMQNVNFLEWLHKFLESNLQPGVNYQRKILSLHLYKTVLDYFVDKLQKSKKRIGLRKQDLDQCDKAKVVKFASELGKWHYLSQNSHKILLSSILDPTEDIREAAGFILSEYFIFKKESYDGYKHMFDYALKLCNRPMFFEAESGALLVKIIGNVTHKLPERNDVIKYITNGGYKEVKPYSNSNLKVSRGYGSIMTLNNQEKLLSALEKRHSPFPTEEKIMKNVSDLKVKVKVPTGTYEGCIMKDPSLIQTKEGEQLQDEARIFENLACISKDGLVGQRTNPKFVEFPHPNSSCEDTYLFDKRDQRRYPCCKEYENVHKVVKKDFWMNSTDIQSRYPTVTTYEVDEQTDVATISRLKYHAPHSEIKHFFSRENKLHSSNKGKARRFASHQQAEKFQFTVEDPFVNSSVSKYSWWGNETEYEISEPLNVVDQSPETKSIESRHNRSCKGRANINKCSYKEYMEHNVESRGNSEDSFAVWGSRGDYKKDEHIYSTQVGIMNEPAQQMEDITRCNSSYGIASITNHSDSKPSTNWIEKPQSPLKGSHNNSLGSEELAFQDLIPKPLLSDKLISKEKAFQTNQHDYHSSMTKNMFSPQCRELTNRKKHKGKKVQTSEQCLAFGKRMEAHGSYIDICTNESIQRREISYSSLTPLSMYLVSEAEQQLQHVSADFFKAATSGSPLYGTLMALTRISVQSDSPEHGKMTDVEVGKTIKLLEKIVTHLLSFLAEKSSMGAGIAPSFAEMDEAIKNNIQDFEEDDMHLSPAHQILLNCVWLNLKTSCMLASGLPCNKTCSIQIIERCGNIITQVLTRCRHKGAIESAGVALTNFVKTVSSYHSPDIVQKILEEQLNEFLESLLHGYGRGSVTRRSAGFSILIQKIITNDTLSTKPLLHACLTKLLKIAKTPLDPQVISNPESVLMDLPQAQSLHFLRILVQDSSLRQDIAHYTSTIAIICFSTFTSPVWTIRNAALQLSGSLIPKLVGQKKIQDEDITLGSSISAEELFSHFLELTDFILKSFQTAVDVDKSKALQLHANLIPMLSLLAKVAVGVHFINNHMTLKIKQFRHCLQRLLSSPIYHVRKLAAKTHERFVPLSDTYETITALVNKLNMHINCTDKNCNCPHDENEVNGVLLALKYHVEKLKCESKNVKEVELYLQNIGTLLKEIATYDQKMNLYTYLNKLLLDEILEGYIEAEDKMYNMDEVYQRMFEVQRILISEDIKPSFKPGLILWAANRIGETIKKCTADELIITWYNSYMLFNSYPDIIKSGLTCLNLRIQNDKSIKAASKSSLAISLLKITSGISGKYSLYILNPIFEMMLSLLENKDINIVISHKDVQTLSSMTLNDKVLRCEYIIIALPVVAGLLAQFLIIRHSFDFLPVADLKLLLDITECIKERSDASKFDEECRLNVAKAANFLATPLQTVVAPQLRKHIKLTSKDKIIKIMKTVLNVVINLLQDEVQEVRNEAAKFFANYGNNRSMMLNPYSSLKKILNPSVLLELLPSGNACDFLLEKLQYRKSFQDLKCKSIESNCIRSPFDHGKTNIYEEEVKVIDLIAKSLLSLLKNPDAKIKKHLRIRFTFMLKFFKSDASTISSMLDDIETCGLSSVSSEHTAYYIVAKKIIYCSEIMASLNMKISCDMECVIQSLKQKIAVQFL